MRARPSAWPTKKPLRVAVIGAGWAGLAAAVHGVRLGHRITVFEMASEPGGRARSTPDGLDNGQHILIGAYSATLALMRSLGVNAAQALHRSGLALLDAQGLGLSLPQGAGLADLLWGAMRVSHWGAHDKLSLLRAAMGWRIKGFRCDERITVAELCAGLTPAVKQDLIEPLCVAALNTPAAQASGAVFLRVLHDALFSQRGACDLLLPKKPLSSLLPEAAIDALKQANATVHWRHRVQSLQCLFEQSGDQPRDQGDLQQYPALWAVDEQPFDRVILACTSTEAARIARAHNPSWAQQAEGIRFESIVTTYLKSPGTRWPSPMLLLRDDPNQTRFPAQFAFDLGQIGHPLREHFAFVTSAANGWLERGLDAITEAVMKQALHTPGLKWASPPEPLRSLAAKRATFLCSAGLQRPLMRIARGLWAAGDYVDGPYPATLEGAVRSGLAAANNLQHAE